MGTQAFKKDILCDIGKRAESDCFPPMFRFYILYAITHRSNPAKNREIKDDIRLLCTKCHRNCDYHTDLKTVYENGKRYCENSHFKFEY